MLSPPAPLEKPSIRSVTGKSNPPGPAPPHPTPECRKDIPFPPQTQKCVPPLHSAPYPTRRAPLSLLIRSRWHLLDAMVHDSRCSRSRRTAEMLIVDMSHSTAPTDGRIAEETHYHYLQKLSSLPRNQRKDQPTLKDALIPRCTALRGEGERREDENAGAWW